MLYFLYIDFFFDILNKPVCIRNTVLCCSHFLKPISTTSIFISKEAIMSIPVPSSLVITEMLIWFHFLVLNIFLFTSSRKYLLRCLVLDADFSTICISVYFYYWSSLNQLLSVYWHPLVYQFKVGTSAEVFFLKLCFPCYFHLQCFYRYHNNTLSCLF